MATNRSACVLALVCLTGLPFAGFSAASAAELFGPYGGEVTFNARFRLEHVDQQGVNRTADANTARIALGYRTPWMGAFQAFVEGEVVESLGSARFNSTVNNRTTYPTVVDPDTVELNQGYIRFDGFPDTRVVAGRQVINVANQRHIGAAAFRQNHQTFDALRVTNRSVGKVTVDTFYSPEVHRIFGRRSAAGSFNTDLAVLNVAIKPRPEIGISAYGHLFDIDDVPAQSSKTFGVRLSAKRQIGTWAGTLNAEVARQSDYGNNQTGFDAGYYVLEPAVAKGPFTLRAKVAMIDGRGDAAFQFPFGTNHAFQGWADKFLNTPVGGIREQAIAAVYKVPPGTLLAGIVGIASVHRFTSDSGDRYGQELDLRLAKSLSKGVTVSAKLADYKADGFSVDTQKWWLTLALSF
jgi:hypothetical protein